MWTQPGYGDHLEASNPGLRAQMAEVGAPPRFEDVVASMVPCQDERGAALERHLRGRRRGRDRTRAAELGGEVTVPPFDAPWVRTTVITDPQGASFMASKFVPENKELLEARRGLPGRLASRPGPGRVGRRPHGAPPRPNTLSSPHIRTPGAARCRPLPIDFNAQHHR